jgi:hypothetical protein
MFDSIIQFLPTNCGLRGKRFRAVYYSITFEMPFGLNASDAESNPAKSSPSRRHQTELAAFEFSVLVPIVRLTLHTLNLHIASET